ncbi:MAG: hypothetical protein R3D45_13255 [Rhizobiaceae bacterium]
MKRIALAAMAALIATGASAGGQFQVGGSGPLLVKSATLAIKVPVSLGCQGTAKMKAWIYTTKGGTISYMMIRHGQGAGAVQTAVAKKVGNKYVAEISRTLTIHHPIDAKYRIAAKGIGNYKFSNWVPLKAC